MLPITPSRSAVAVELHGRAAGRGDRRPDLLVLGRGLLVAVRLGEGLGARQRGLDAAPFVERDTVREVPTVDVESSSEPSDGLNGRAGLAALDLADVLLGEAIAGEIGLGHPRSHAQLTNAFA